MELYPFYEGLIFAFKNTPWLLINLMTLPVFILLSILTCLIFINRKTEVSKYQNYILAPFFLIGLVFLIFWSIGDAQYLGLLTRMYSPLLPLGIIGLGLVVGKTSHPWRQILFSLAVFTVVCYSLSIDLRLIPNWQQMLFDLNFGKTVVYLGG